MPKSKLIRLSQLEPSNRKLLAAAQRAGLSPEEIIRKSVEAAYGKLRRPVTNPGRNDVAARNHHKPATVNGLAKRNQPPTRPGDKRGTKPT